VNAKIAFAVAVVIADVRTDKARSQRNEGNVAVRIILAAEKVKVILITDCRSSINCRVGTSVAVVIGNYPRVIARLPEKFDPDCVVRTLQYVKSRLIRIAASPDGDSEKVNMQERFFVTEIKKGNYIKGFPCLK